MFTDLELTEYYAKPITNKQISATSQAAPGDA